MEIIKITSTQNELIKYAVKLQNPKFRKSQKMILCDGEKTISGLIAQDVEFEYIFLEENSDLINKVRAKKLILTNKNILKKITTTDSCCDCAGIIKEMQYSEQDFEKLNKIVLLEGIKDAGNLGTIIRSASAFSLDGIILFGNCVDLYNTKVIRASAQNMFKIPILRTNNIDFIKKLNKTHKIISTTVNSKNDLTKYKFPQKYIIAFGSEAQGLSGNILNISDDNLTLKMDKNVESLNIAVCCSVVFALIKFCSLVDCQLD